MAAASFGEGAQAASAAANGNNLRTILLSMMELFASYENSSQKSLGGSINGC
jgi:hypothetical protein